ncbi:MAG: hypothetical protein IT532_11880 [Burkholderiales bacterium]|nr:hypothetical protein [Burkholderiales bacterium]
MIHIEERRVHTGRRASDLQREQELSMLRAELEMLMAEREHLLRTVGAAAMFVAKMDDHVDVLPKDSYDAAYFVAQAVNTLPEETLNDALESVRMTYGETLEDNKARLS